VNQISVARAVRDYAALQPRFRQAANAGVEVLTELLNEVGINYLSVTGRAKAIASFAAKASREKAGRREFRDPLAQIGDLIGIRVITYVRSDVAAVVAALGDELQILDDRDLGEETASEGRFGYSSRHLQVAMPPSLRTAFPDLADRQVQIQIRTVLQHAWAEFEHDIRYKGSVPPEHLAEFNRRFILAAGLLELADGEFSAIRDRLREGVGEVTETVDDDPRISAPELAAFLAGQYADAGWSRTDHYEWIGGLVLELGITSLSELAGIIRTVDTHAINRAMSYRHPTGAVRRLDDALLMAFGAKYLSLNGNAHRVDLLRQRLARFEAASVSD